MSKLWNPFGKRLPIVVTMISRELLTESTDKLDALAQSWAPTFSEIRPVSETLADQVAEELASKYDISDFGPPSSAAIGRHLTPAWNNALVVVLDLKGGVFFIKLHAAFVLALV